MQGLALLGGQMTSIRSPAAVLPELNCEDEIKEAQSFEFRGLPEDSKEEFEWVAQTILQHLCQSKEYHWVQ